MSSQSNVTPVGELTVCSALCCSITGWDISSIYRCFGCGVDGLFCCIKSNMVCCKMVDERTSTDARMLKFSEGGCFCVTPTTCIQQQNQCCCLDSRCALPCTDQVPCMCTCLPCCVLYPKFGCCAKVKDLVQGDVPSAASKAAKPEADLTDVPVEHVRVCQACMCSICGLFAKWPDCLGGKTEGMCLCCSFEESCCKVIKAENEDKICCVWCDGGSYLVIPSTCVQVNEQFFCIDSRCAFPCTDKVPCICTLLPGCVICASKAPKIACCPLVGDISPQTKVTDASLQGPSQMEMK